MNVGDGKSAYARENSGCDVWREKMILNTGINKLVPPKKSNKW